MPAQTPAGGVLVALPWVELSRGDSGQTGEVPAGESYGVTFERLTQRIQASERIAASERLTAPVLFARLLAVPPSRRLTMVHNSDRFTSYLLCEMLLENCRESWFEDTAKALSMAELACAAAERLDRDFYGETLVATLAARAWAFLANSRRINNEFQGAERAFEQADRLLEGLGVEPTERAELLSLKVSLCRDLRRFDRAAEHLEAMSTIYREVGDDHHLGRVLVQKASVASIEGDFAAAAEATREGLELLDPVKDPRLVAQARQGCAYYLAHVGRPEEARQQLDLARALFEKLGDRLNLVRVRWTDGLILSGLDRLDEAEAALLEVRGEYERLGDDYDAALVCLDLAILYAEAGRTRAMRELAERMLPIFRSHRIGREAMAALILFQHAAEKEIATLGLVREIAQFLKKAPTGVPASQDDRS